MKYVDLSQNLYVVVDQRTLGRAVLGKYINLERDFAFDRHRMLPEKAVDNSNMFILLGESLPSGTANLTYGRRNFRCDMVGWLF